MQVFGTVVLNLAFTAEQTAPVFFLVVEAVGVDSGLSTQVNLVDIGNDIAVCRNACAVSVKSPSEIKPISPAAEILV